MEKSNQCRVEYECNMRYQNRCIYYEENKAMVNTYYNCKFREGLYCQCPDAQNEAFRDEIE